MNERKKYLRKVKGVFQFVGKDEKDYFKELEKEIKSFPDETTFDEYVENFGEPKEILLAYYDKYDSSSLVKKVKIRKFLIYITILILLSSLVFIYFIAKAYHDGLNSNIDNVEIIIKEE